MDDFTKLIDRAKKMLKWDSLTQFQRVETLLHPHHCWAQLENGQICACDSLCLTRDQLKRSESSIPVIQGPSSVSEQPNIKRESQSPTSAPLVISLQMESSEPLPSNTWLTEAGNVLPERTVRHSDANINTDVERMKQQMCLKCHHITEDHLKLVKDVHDQEGLLVTFLFLKDIELLESYAAAELVPSAAKRVFSRLKEVLKTLINHKSDITMPLLLRGHFTAPPFETPSVEYLLFNMISRQYSQFAPLSDAFRIVRRVIIFLNKLELPRPESVYTQTMTGGQKRLYEAFYEHWLVYCHLPRVTGTFKQHRVTTVFGIRFLMLIWNAVTQFFEKTAIVEGGQTMVPVMGATACTVLSTNYCHFSKVIKESLFGDPIEATRQNHIQPAYLRMIKGSIMSSNSPLTGATTTITTGEVVQGGATTLEVNFNLKRERFGPTFRKSKDSFCLMQYPFDEMLLEIEKEEKTKSSKSSSRSSSELSSRLSSLSEASNVSFQNEVQSENGLAIASMVNGENNISDATGTVQHLAPLLETTVGGSASLIGNPAVIRESEDIFRQLIFDAVDSVSENLETGRSINGSGGNGGGVNAGGHVSGQSPLLSSMLATYSEPDNRNDGTNLSSMASLKLEGSLLPVNVRSRVNEPHRCLTASQVHQHFLEQKMVISSVCPSSSRSSIIASTSTSTTSNSATYSACQSIGQLAVGAPDYMGAISDLLVRQARRVSNKISAYTSVKGAQFEADDPFKLSGLASHNPPNSPLKTVPTLVVSVSSSEVTFTESEDDLIVRPESNKNVVSFVSLNSPTLCFCHFSQILELIVEAKQLVIALESHLLKPLLGPQGFESYCRELEVYEDYERKHASSSSSDSGSDSGVEQSGAETPRKSPRASFHLAALERYPHISYVLGLRSTTDKREQNVAKIPHPLGYGALVEVRSFINFLVRRIISYMQLVISHCEDVNLEMVEDVADFVFFDGPFQPFIRQPADVAVKSLFYDTLSRRCHAIMRLSEGFARPAIDDEPRMNGYFGMPQCCHYNLLSLVGIREEKAEEFNQLMTAIAQAQATERAEAAAAAAVAAARAKALSLMAEQQRKNSCSSRGRPKKRSLKKRDSTSTSTSSNSPTPTKGKRTLTPTKATTKTDVDAKIDHQGKRGRHQQSSKMLKRSESLASGEEGSSFSSADDTQTEVERGANSNTDGSNSTTSASELSKTASRQKRSLPTTKSVAPKKRRRKAARLTLKRRKTTANTTVSSGHRSRRSRYRYQTVSSSSSIGAGTSSSSFRSRRSSSLRSTSGNGGSSGASSCSSDEEGRDSDDSIGFGRVLRKSARIRNAINRDRRRSQAGYVLSSSDEDETTDEEAGYQEEEVDDGGPPKLKPWDYLEGVTACFIHRDHFPLVLAPNSSRKDPKPWYTFGMGKSIRSEYVKRKQLLFMQIQEIVRVCLPNMLPEFVNQYMFAEGTKTLLMMKNKQVFCCTVFKTHPEAGYCEIVFCTTNRKMQGKGFGRAMLHIIKRYCLDRAIPKLLVMGDKDNHVFFLKCKFTDTITVPQELYEGELCDCTAAVLLECIIEPEEELPEYPMLFENELALMDDPTEQEMMEAAELAVAAIDTTGISHRAAEKLRRQALKQEMLRRRRQFADLPPVKEAEWRAMDYFLKDYAKMATAEDVDRLRILTEVYQEEIHLADRIYDRFRCVPTWEVVCRRHQSRHYRSIGMLYYDMVMMILAIIYSVKGKKQKARAEPVHELNTLFKQLIEEHFPETRYWQL